jgi:hypothetical protein
MIGFFEQMPANGDLQKPEDKPRDLSRVERFGVILAATKGEPDDNLKFGAYLALTDPNIFRQFDDILRMSVPQVDAVTVHAVKDGKILDVMAMQMKGGPHPRPNHAGHGKDAEGEKPGDGKRGDAPQSDADDDDDDEGEKDLVAAITEAQKKAGKKPAVPLSVPIPPADATGESLAKYLAGKKPVANADLAKVEGKIMEEMRKRGAKSSLHVPAAYNGEPILISFWSRDADAFPAPAQMALAGVVQIMVAPKNAEAQASK